MFVRSLRIFMIVMLLSAGGVLTFAQSADNKTSIILKTGESDDEDKPKSFKETMVKLRIEKEKKEYDEMINRGETALKLSEELERAYAKNGKLTSDEVVKLETVEKLVKKIRNELGGDDEGEDKENNAGNEFIPTEKKLSPSDAITSFRESAAKLFDELKKTTRFTISAAAIQASNSLLKITRFLRISN